MAAGVPLLKLGLLLVRTAAKPLASELKRRAAVTEGSLLQRACIGVGQLTHTSSKSAQLWLAGHRRVKVKPLDDPKALSAGADVMGEVRPDSAAVATSCDGALASGSFGQERLDSERRTKPATRRASADAAGEVASSDGLFASRIELSHHDETRRLISPANATPARWRSC